MAVGAEEDKLQPSLCHSVTPSLDHAKDGLAPSAPSAPSATTPGAAPRAATPRAAPGRGRHLHLLQRGVVVGGAAAAAHGP